MDFLTAIKTVLGKYVDFSGRASRPEYWYWILAVLILSVALAMIEGALLAPVLGTEAFNPASGQPLRLILNLAIFLPTLAVTVRRLHDIDKSGWWILIALVPLIGGLILLWWYVQPSDEGSNQFG